MNQDTLLVNLEKPTAEEIARQFTAAMDSVNLITELSKESTVITGDEQDKQDTISRNKEHLKIMISRDWFSEEQKEALRSVL